jgi:hypothetical protein
MRQRNVQQQNLATEEAIRHQARYWRSAALPAALVEAASARGVDCSTAIVLELDVDFPGMPSLFGMLLTNTERFIEFEIDADESHSTVRCVEAWRDVTADQNLSMHNRGIGAAKGALALKVLHELNAGA